MRWAKKRLQNGRGLSQFCAVLGAKWDCPPLRDRFTSASKRIARWRAAWRHYHSLGERGERAAARHLRRLGYKIVGRHERGRLGELDLVAVDGRTVVFVEVKTRRTHDAGHPAEAVGPEKQARLTRLALAYLKRHSLLDCSARFDVVAVTWPESAKRPTIDHRKNAFEAVGRGQLFS